MAHIKFREPARPRRWHHERMKLQKFIGLAISASGLAIIVTGIIH